MASYQNLLTEVSLARIRLFQMKWSLSAMRDLNSKAPLPGNVKPMGNGAEKMLNAKVQTKQTRGFNGLHLTS